MLSVGFALLCASPEAKAQEALEQARQRYAVGEREYSAGRYWQSAKAFEEAYDLSRKGDLLYNAARAYDRGEYYVRAAETYEAYLKAGNPPDAQQIESRIAALRKTFCQMRIVTDRASTVYIDGKEYYKTPMNGLVWLDSGYHRIDAREGNRLFSREQQFSPGEKYEFDAVFSESTTIGGANLGEVNQSKPRTRRVAVVLGLGGAIDVSGDNFPPHQMALALGAEIRMLESRLLALDLGFKIPFELLQSWQNAGLLLGLRGVYTPVPRLPLELVLALDLGFAGMDYRSSAPLSGQWPCASPSYLPSCTIYALRIVPTLAVAYRFHPAFELRAQLVGLEVNVAQPMFAPRYLFGLQAGCRFF